MRFCEAPASDTCAPFGQPTKRRTRKLSLGSVDSGIDLDVTSGHRTSTSTDDDMRVGRVPPTLSLGHGRPPAQALAEPATPGAQFVQYMAPVPVLARQPGALPWEIKDNRRNNPSLRPRSSADAAATSEGRSDSVRRDDSRTPLEPS